MQEEFPESEDPPARLYQQPLWIFSRLIVGSTGGKLVRFAALCLRARAFVCVLIVVLEFMDDAVSEE